MSDRSVVDWLFLVFVVPMNLGAFVMLVKDHLRWRREYKEEKRKMDEDSRAFAARQDAKGRASMDLAARKHAEDLGRRNRKAKK